MNEPLLQDHHPRSDIVIEQCLFGYRHGHRMLTSSRQLSTEVVQTFLGRTDATVDSSAQVTILQGFPVLPAKAYAIGRTWADRREDARPGTVLTHLLLIKPADLGLVGIIWPLLELLQIDPNDRDETDFAYPLNLPNTAKYHPHLDQTNFHDFDVVKILEQLYQTAVHGTVAFRQRAGFAKNTIAERLLAAIWEQQWPRLRRSFSFIVSHQMSRGSSIANQYAADLVMIKATDRLPIETMDQPQDWIKILNDDLITPGPLRQFLRVNGADLKETRSAMITLVKLYQCFTSSNWNQAVYRESAKIVLSKYRNANEGKLLKRRLFDLSEWLVRHDFRATEFIEVWLDLGRQGFTCIAMNWSRLIAVAKKENVTTLLNLVISAVDDDELEISEEFRHEYLRSLTLSELLPLTEARPSLFHAALHLHPQWLEESQLWKDFRSRPATLATSVSVMATDGPDDLDWTAVVENMLTVTDGLSSNELLRRLPLEALHRLLESLSTRSVAAQWLQGLTVRKNEVIDWIAAQSQLSLPLLHWICGYLDYLDMWRPSLAETWTSTAKRLPSFPAEDQTLLATHALCTMVSSKSSNAIALLNVLEIGRNQIINDAIGSRERQYLSDHLPRLQKSSDDWDLAKRLDVWAAETLTALNQSRTSVAKAFRAPKEANRLLKKIK